MHRIHALFALTLTALFAHPHDAEAGQQSGRVEVTPERITVASGDTVDLSIEVFDAEGNRLPEAEVQGFLNPGSLGTLLPGGRFVAGEAVSGTLAIRSGEAIGRVEVTVTRPAPSSLEIDPLPERIAAGSVVPLSARGRDRDGDPVLLEPAGLRWETSDPGVVAIGPLGGLVARAPGEATVSARVRHGGPPAELTVEAPTGERPGLATSVRVRVVAGPEGALSIDGPTSLDTGDVGRFSIDAADAFPRWSVTPHGARIDPDGGFVADRPGTYLVQARLGDRVAEMPVEVTPRAARRELRLVGRAAVADRLTADLSVFTGSDGRDYAYVGTAQSNAILVYDVTDPTRPVLTDSVTTDARMVLDVKVNDDATLAVFSREGAANRANGIVILDLADPAHPAVVSEFTETVSGGVHNTYFDGDHVYATHDGDGSLHVIDVSDPERPREVGEWHTETSGRSLHDLFVKDGIAYLAYWRDGLVILDVGGGDRGGSPSNPVEIGRLVYDLAEIYGPDHIMGTHSVYVDGDRAYVGDEVYPTMFDLEQPIHPRGFIHVVDISNLEKPRAVGRYQVPEAGAHNHWVEDGVLYSGYYQGGARVVDVSGDLRGDLYPQGREIASYVTDAPVGEAFLPFRAFAFGAQPHRGHVFVSDMSSGLWVFELTGEPRPVLPGE